MNENIPASLFAAGDCGKTIARNLLRTLASQNRQSGASLLDAALEHPLINCGLRSLALETLLTELETWLNGSDTRFEYQHVLLAAHARDHLNMARDWRLTMMLMTRAYAAGDVGFAEQTAASALRDAGENYELSAQCFNILGRCCSGRGEIEVAAKHFAAGANVARQGRIGFEEWDHRTNLVWCYQAMGDHLHALREIAMAESIARQIKRPDALAKTLLDRGNSYLLLGNIEEARPAFEGALAAAEEAGDDAHRSDALGNLGNIAYFVADYAQSEDFHRRSLAISRTLTNKESLQFDLNNLAQALWELRRSTAAVEALEEALTIAHKRKDESSIAQYTARLREMRQAVGKHVGEPARAAEPRSPGVLPTRTEVAGSPAKKTDYEIEKQVRSLLNQGNVPSARQFLEQRLQQMPGDWQALCLYGIILGLSGEDAKAREQFEKAIELSPAAMEPHYRLVDLCTKTGELDALLEHYKRVVADAPFQAGARLGLALIHSRQQRTDAAIQQAMEAVRLAPDEELPLRVLAEAQLVKALALLRSNWDGAWLVFQDCATSLFRLTSLNSPQQGQWLNYAARAFEQFAMESHRANPPFSVWMDSRELSMLAHAARFYNQSHEKDPLRSTQEDIARISDVITSLAEPEQITITAGHLRLDGFGEDALTLLIMSLQINPEQAEAYYQLAQIVCEMDKAGGKEAALAYIRCAIQIDPQNQQYQQAERRFQSALGVPETGEEETREEENDEREPR